jgi:hypothetical protein
MVSLQFGRGLYSRNVRTSRGIGHCHNPHRLPFGQWRQVSFFLLFITELTQGMGRHMMDLQSHGDRRTDTPHLF